ncbi:hypothetical protein ACROYT_G036366 [Oculina patagonica]
MAETGQGQYQQQWNLHDKELPNRDEMPLLEAISQFPITNLEVLDERLEDDERCIVDVWRKMMKIRGFLTELDWVLSPSVSNYWNSIQLKPLCRLLIQPNT